MPGNNEASQILQTRIALNDSPDVFVVHAINEIPRFAKSGYLEDLSDQPFVENLLEISKEAVTNDGKVLAAPLETLHWGYLYNIDMFEEYGLELPQTLSEMEAVVDKLIENGETPFISAYQDSDVPQLYVPLEIGALVNTESPDFIDHMNNDEGSLGDLDVFFDMMDLQNANGTDRPFETDSDQGSNKFANGDAAMWIMGPWYAETILAANPDFNFGVAPLPVNENPEATMINSSVSTSLAVSSESKHKEVAKALVNYMLDEEDSGQLFQDLKFNPVTTFHDFETYPWLTAALNYVNEGKSYLDPSIPNAVKSESEKVLQSYLGGQISQEEVIQALDRAWVQANKLNE
jgi:raffinose/stachyose/melibiose transport system substrate-binding protein